ncbi:hypothetical protein T03_16846 [Trichinella britovi]|uniref:Uncharacterized protein n=2 Tax=Trichinella TaxID=6333 RepID=A0A0V1CSR3_TRIBR|nr:hypothetical protein T05_2946 [Trichinella murrelli]KRY52329.1 hypothetical protein T03_16846 [Trichinella britovi]
MLLIGVNEVCWMDETLCCLLTRCSLADARALDLLVWFGLLDTAKLRWKRDSCSSNRNQISSCENGYDGHKPQIVGSLRNMRLSHVWTWSDTWNSDSLATSILNQLHHASEHNNGEYKV